MKLLTILHTVKYLRFKQVYYQLRYRLVPERPAPYKPAAIAVGNTVDRFREKVVPSVVPRAVLPSFARGERSYTFHFVGHTVVFDQKIDWNFPRHGKLWTYNLNYFDFLLSPECSEQTGLSLIQEYIREFPSLKDGLEPYPTSLRIINWIKFMTLHRRADTDLLKAISWQCERLSGRPEYHLMGNHLLENGFALLTGGSFLGQARYYNLGKYLVLSELKKQILADGGHFEQSPMYHQIILHRLLDAVNLLRYNRQIKEQEQFENDLRDYASRMVCWMQKMTFSDNTFPCFNDATPGIAPASNQLASYARELGITPLELPLGESGYRMWKKPGMEFCFDIGNVTAAYQPGHTHADTFSFCIHINSLPVIVDTGISTYEKNRRRHLERSTLMHNTVTVDNQNSTAVWNGFRVAKRARVQIQEDLRYRLSAWHDGYKAQGKLHQRTFDWQSEELFIEDFLQGKSGSGAITSRLHFHPDRKVRIEGNKILVDDSAVIEASGYDAIFTESYAYCQGYNHQRNAIRVCGSFSSRAAWKFRAVLH